MVSSTLSRSYPKPKSIKGAKQSRQEQEQVGPAYNTELRADIHVEVNNEPKMSKGHRVEWRKVMEGDPVQINPSVGEGFRVMSVTEWSARWKRNEDFPTCEGCGGGNTKEHHFVQTWCRGKKKWESEILCTDCHAFTLRTYEDPDFLTPEEFEKQRWKDIVAAYRTKRTA